MAKLVRYTLLCFVSAVALFTFAPRWSEVQPKHPFYDAAIANRIERALAATGNLQPEACVGKKFKQFAEDNSDDTDADLNSDSLWKQFVANVSTCDLYRADAGQVKKILHRMATEKIVDLDTYSRGTQMKWKAHLETGETVIIKPGRFPFDYERSVNTFVFDDMERDYAEIAAFHLDRILGFRRAVPTAGRWLDLANEVKPVAGTSLKKTIYISPAYKYDSNKTEVQLDDNISQLCVYGDCLQHCNRINSVCGNPNITHVAVQMHVPDILHDASIAVSPFKGPSEFTGYSLDEWLAHENSSYVGNKLLWRAPYQRSEDYCNKCVKRQPLFAHGSSLPTMIDTGVFDYLIGNWDRQMHERLTLFDKPDKKVDSDLFIIHSDHGRAFGRYSDDDEQILSPLRQCCVIHPRTLHTLLSFYKKPGSLGAALKKSLSHDAIAPVISPLHFVAIERRLHRVMTVVVDCLLKAKNDADVVRSTYDNEDIDGTYQFTDYEKNCTAYR